MLESETNHNLMFFKEGAKNTKDLSDLITVKSAIAIFGSL